jgi:hypothetical protein
MLINTNHIPFSEGLVNHQPASSVEFSHGFFNQKPSKNVHHPSRQVRDALRSSWRHPNVLPYQAVLFQHMKWILFNG